MRTFRKYLVTLVSAAMVLGSLAATAPASAASIASAPFSDVTSSTSYANAVNFMAQQGVINGTGNGQYTPNTPVTRAEMAKILVNEAGKGSVATALASMTPQFTDAASIPTWAWGYVNAAVSMGVIKGYPDGTFRANNNVTDAEAAAMFIRLLGDDWSVTGAWPNNYILAGYSLGVFGGLNSESANVPALRGEIAQMAYNSALYAEYTTPGSQNANGQNSLSTGGGLYAKNGSTGYPERLYGTVSNASNSAITLTSASSFGPLANTSVATYALESSVTVVGASSLTALNGDIVWATLDSNGLINWISVKSAVTTTAETLNDGTQTSAPSGYSAGISVGGDLVTVTDANGNKYLLFKDGTTLQYAGSTASAGAAGTAGNPSVSLNGATSVALVGNEAAQLVPGASITATTSSGVVVSLAETNWTVENAQFTSLNPTNDFVTFNTESNGATTANVVNADGATVTLNGQASTLSALQANDVINVEIQANAGASAAGTVSPVTALSIAATRNTVSGTITAVNTTGGSSPTTTLTVQPTSGNAVTLTADTAYQPTAKSLQVNQVVTIALDSAGDANFTISSSASTTATVVELTGTGSGQSIVNGAPTTTYSLTGINGPTTATFAEAASSGIVTMTCNGSTTSNVTGCVYNSTDAMSQPNIFATSTSIANAPFYVLSMSSGTVSDATYLGTQVTPFAGDTFEVYSTGTGAVTIEMVTSTGSLDTNAAHTATGATFTGGLLTIVNGQAFSGVTPEKYLGFSGLQVGDAVTLYTASVGGTAYYAIVDSYR